MKVTLRDYQEDAHARLDAARARGVNAALGVAATGLGKTVIFASYAEKIGGRTLVLAHRDELITQAAAKVLEVWPDLGATDNVLALLRGSGEPTWERLAQSVERNPRGVGIVKADADDVHATAIIASVQTLSRPRRLARFMATWDEQWSMLGRSDPLSLVVVDEAHHATADSYGKILDALRAGEDGGPLLLGVTATPDRADGKGLDGRFTEIVFAYDLLWGIRAGYLSDLRGLRIRLSDFDLADVKVSRGDYEAGAAGRALEDAHAPRFIAEAWMRDHDLPDGQTVTARDRPTLVFTPTVALAEQVAAEFVGRGIPASFVSGETPLLDRRRILAEFAAGSIRVLANCAVLTEGFDAPFVSCIVQARPTKSRGLYTQMIGRGTRRYPEKADCLVLDVVGSSDDLSLVTVPSLFGIDQKVRPYRDGEPLTAAVEEHGRELVRLGRITAEEADLFAAVRAEGIAWVAIHRTGEPLRRYERTLGRDKPVVVLAQRQASEDVWTAGLWWQPTRDRPEHKLPLMVNVSLELAQGVAEDYVRKNGGGKLVEADAAWRVRKPTPKAKAAAKRWRLAVDPGWNAGQLSDALDAHIARIKSQPRAVRR